MDSRTARIMTFALLAASIAGGAVLVTQAGQPGRHRVEVPTPPADPWTARDQWVQLRGGEPEQLTPMARPTARVPMRRRLLRRIPRGGTEPIRRERPEGFVPAAIVLHATGSGQPGVDVATLDELHRFFSRPSSRGSVHYAIDRRGRVMRMVPDEHAALHVSRPGWNDISIGIMLLNDNSGTEPFPPAQLAAASQLVRSLGRRYRIPVEAVVRPPRIGGGDRSDLPGNFPWRTWRATLRSRR